MDCEYFKLIFVDILICSYQIKTSTEMSYPQTRMISRQYKQHIYTALIHLRDVQTHLYTSVFTIYSCVV